MTYDYGFGPAGGGFGPAGGGFGPAGGRSLNLKVARIRGIEVHVHWLLLLLFAFLLLENLLRLRPEDYPFTQWLIFVTVILFSVLTHELGHCYAAHRQGGGAERVLLWPLGGLAYATAPQDPRCQFWVAAGGPIADVAKLLAAGSICLGLGWELLPQPTFTEFSTARCFFQSLVLWNGFLLALNLLPCLPLDGGRMFQAVSWSIVESHGRATLLALRVSSVTAVAALVAAVLLLLVSFGNREFKGQHPFLFQLTFGLFLLSLAHFAELRSIRHRLAHGEEEEGIFGYDFSLGYTSLERPAARQRTRRSFLARVRSRLRQRDMERSRRREDLRRQRLDQILEKISREGMGSLSRAEQRFLERSSRELRK